MTADLAGLLRPEGNSLEDLRADAGGSLLRGGPARFTRPTLSEKADPSPAGANWTEALPDNCRHVRRNVRRRFIHALNVKNAAKDLDELPAGGESVHIIMRGNWHGWDLVPAVLRLADGATIDELTIATLGFNKDNAVELGQLLDAGQVRRVRFLCSVYFRDATRDVFKFLASELATRNGELLAMRNHAKLLLFALSDGRRLTVESSANLRSCRNVEQMALHNDPELYNFHAGWIDQQFAAARGAAPNR